jgi:Mor family transcriptional regulator
MGGKAIPVMLQALQDVVGEAAASKLLNRWRNQYVYVPKRAKNLGALVECIGLEPAIQLSFALGGTTIEMPKNFHAAVARKHRRIARDRKAGMTLAELAKKYDLTQRRIRTILAEQRKLEPSP